MTRSSIAAWPAALVLVAVLGAPASASADPGPGPAGWHLTKASYVALGGAAKRSGQVGRRRYAASGFDVRGTSEHGHGGYARLEEGDFGGLLGSAPRLSEPHVLAFDLGYAYGGPLAGEWDGGLLGFLEVGLTGWRASSAPTDAMFLAAEGGAGALATSAGFGLSYGAVLEGQIDLFRVGVAVQRREVPLFIGDPTGERYAGSTTLQLRVEADL